MTRVDKYGVTVHLNAVSDQRFCNKGTLNAACTSWLDRSLRPATADPPDWLTHAVAVAACCCECYRLLFASTLKKKIGRFDLNLKRRNWNVDLLQLKCLYCTGYRAAEFGAYTQVQYSCCIRMWFAAMSALRQVIGPSHTGIWCGKCRPIPNSIGEATSNILPCIGRLLKWIVKYTDVRFWTRYQDFEKRQRPSVRMLVRMEQLGSHWTDACEILYLSRVFFGSVCRKVLSRMKNVSDKRLRQNQNTHFVQ
jgi:hypothetical protein